MNASDTPPLPPRCPKCRASLPPDAPFGLCPACLLDAAGVESEAQAAHDPFAAPLDPATLRLAFPQWEILAPLGAGGMGRVYKVRQPHLDRIVALKVVPPEFARDPAWVERFTREARALARLNHPNIVQVYDFGQTSDSPPISWLLMEYVDGVSLRQVQRTGGLSAREALTLIPKLCDALQYAHEKGVLHRDIKPENILLDAVGNVKVADFGLAKLGGPNAPSSLTITGARLGTAAYMAPEQIETPQDVDHRADIYSLGVVFYELLTGGLPLGRFPAPSEKSGSDPRLDQIVFRTLEKERDRRYQAAGDVRTALDTVAAGPPEPVRVPPPAPLKPEPRLQKTTRPLTSSVPPPLPPGKVKKVLYHDDGRPFPSSSAEALGYGCGWFLSSPFRVLFALLPCGIPDLWHNILFKLHSLKLVEAYPSSMLWVAAFTGLAALIAARPLMGVTRWPDRESIKRRAPVFFAGGLVLWAGLLMLIFVVGRSWPTQGVARSLILTISRPPVTADAATPDLSTSDKELNERFRRSMVGEFAGAEGAILNVSGIEAGFPQSRPILSSFFNRIEDTSPLHKTWELVAAGESSSGLDRRLTQLAGSIIRQLPESLQDTATVDIAGGPSGGVGPWMRLQSEASYRFIGIGMTLGGLLISLAWGRPRLFSLACWAMIGATLVLALSPVPPWLEWAVIPPAKDPGEAPLPNPVVREIAASTDPATAALQRWIDACRRLDHAAADKLSSSPMEPYQWQQAVSVWLKGVPLCYKRMTSKTDGAVQFTFLFMPGGLESVDTRSMVHRSHEFRYLQTPDVRSFSVQVLVKKEGEGYLVQPL